MERILTIDIHQIPPSLCDPRFRIPTSYVIASSCVCTQRRACICTVKKLRQWSHSILKFCYFGCYRCAAPLVDPIDLAVSIDLVDPMICLIPQWYFHRLCGTHPVDLIPSISLISLITYHWKLPFRYLVMEASEESEKSMHWWRLSWISHGSNFSGRYDFFEHVNASKTAEWISYT